MICYEYEVLITKFEFLFYYTPKVFVKLIKCYIYVLKEL